MQKEKFMKHSLLKVILTIFFTCFFTLSPAFADVAKLGMRDMTSAEITAEMGIGWNLGNTLDAKGANETVWGNPYTTQAMIDLVAAKGFKTMRLPVTWQYHTGAAPDYKIEKAWLDRVEEVANYALSNDMYVIINVHHDDDWLIPTYKKADAVKDQLGKIWTQVANRFKDYSDYVIFDTINEPRHTGSSSEWTGGTAEGRDCVNQYHKAAVDAIRATGGNNAKRHLMISTYAASTVQAAMDDLVIPNNDPNTIVSIHSYFPFYFCLQTQSEWGTDSDKQALEAEFDRIYNQFVAKGIPVVLGEWSSNNNNNLQARLAHAKHYVEQSQKRGIPSVWWDNGQKKELGILDRANLSWFFPEIADTVVKAAGQNISKSTLTVNNGTPGGTYKTGSTINITANAPEAGYAFKEWTGDVDTVKDVTAASTSIKLTAAKVTVTATYKEDDSTCIPPGTKMEAENYISMSGVQTEDCTEGGKSVGYFDDNDWMDYHITVPESGSYTMTMRVAAEESGAQVEIRVGDEYKTQFNVEATGGWQEWSTLESSEFYLNSGLYTLRVFAKKGGCNLNWFQYDPKGGSVVVPVTGVSLSPATKTLSVGGTVQLTKTITPSNATDKGVTWSSDNTDAVTVSATGLVTAKAAGSATITVKTNDGSYIATSTIVVNAGEEPVTISLPFSYDGAGEYSWFTTKKPSQTNSWGTKKITINGVDFTNKWSDSFPAAKNGGWTIQFAAEQSWSHFEIK